MYKKFNIDQIYHNNFIDSNMQPLSTSQCNYILSLLDSGHSAHQISSSTGLHISTISRLRRKHCPYQQKPIGGRPPKLSEADTHYAQHLITSRKAENCSQITQILQEITNQSLTSQTTRNHLKNAGMKSVVKVKKPLLTKRHRKERLDFALAHLDWTVEDWKTVVWSDETKINRLGSDGRIWVWKKPGEALSDRLVKETKKFGGGSLMMWGCMLWEELDMAARLMERWMGSFTPRSCRMNSRKALPTMAKTTPVSSFSKTMTLNTSARRPPLGLKTMDLKSYHGQHSLLT